MIQYTGRGDQCKLTIIVMGDGLNRVLNVDTTKPPYNFSFTAGNPIKAVAFASTPKQPATGPPTETFTSSTDAQLNIKSVDFAQGVIKITFNKAPPLVDLSSQGGLMPRTRLDIYLVYAPPLIPGADVLVGPFAVSVQADQILIPSHGLINGDQVKFVLESGNATAALPTPLVETGYYYVVGARGNDFMVSGTNNGPAINITDKGVGSNEVWKKT